jgi:hypothetical protein
MEGREGTGMGHPGKGTENPCPAPFSDIRTHSSLRIPQSGAEDHKSVQIVARGIVAPPRVGYSTQNKRGAGTGLTSELMLSAVGLTRMMVSRVSLWWQRVLWPEGEM